MKIENNKNMKDFQIYLEERCDLQIQFCDELERFITIKGNNTIIVKTVCDKGMTIADLLKEALYGFLEEEIEYHENHVHIEIDHIFRVEMTENTTLRVIRRGAVKMKQF